MHKNIAFIANSSWNLFNFRKSLIQALLDQGHTVHCIAPYDECSEKLVQLGSSFHCLSLDPGTTNPFKDILLFISLVQILKKIRPDTVSLYTVKPNIYGALAARFLKIPCICTISGLGTAFITSNLTTRIVSFLFRISLKYPRKIFFQNQDDLQLFRGRGILSTQNADVVPGSGINPEKFAPRPNAQLEYDFMLIARLIWDKGIREYVTAAARLKDEYPSLRCGLLGPLDVANRTAVPREYIEKTHESGISEYLGETDDVRDDIARSKCIVLPSYREGLPRSLLEGASMAKPLIATDVPGCREIVEDSVNGFLCKSKDSQSLYAAMKKMVELPDSMRTQMGLKAREKVLHTFDETKVISRYITILLNDN